MGHWAFAVPVIAGKEHEPARLADEIHDRHEEYLESRRRAKFTMERLYQFDTPMGSLVVIYSEGVSAIHTQEAFKSSTLPFDAWSLGRIGDITGIDFATAPLMPEPQSLFTYRDEDDGGVRHRGLGFCVPVADDKVDAVLNFADQIKGERAQDMQESRRVKHIYREQTYLNHTPMGANLCVYIEADDPSVANKQFAESASTFDVWFKDEVGAILGMDFSEPLPPIATLLDWYE